MTSKAEATILELLQHVAKIAEDDARYDIAEIVTEARIRCLKRYKMVKLIEAIKH